ncbi:hypothetical protein MD537_11145 [Flavihumibacter sediminis]|nr:hypothetical protein [Flavihumibacter sediminis]
MINNQAAGPAGHQLCNKMDRLLGYIFLGVGLLGFIFFLSYNGTAIPFKEFWFVLSFFLMIGGAYFFAKYKLNERSNQQNISNNSHLAEIALLKETGDKIRVTLENAEIKSRSYLQEIVKEGLPSSIELIEGLNNSNRNYKTEEVIQTYILFMKEYNGKMYKFISDATTMDAYDVKRYIDSQKGIDLFIDSNNPTKYYFDFSME